MVGGTDLRLQPRPDRRQAADGPVDFVNTLTLRSGFSRQFNDKILDFPGFLTPVEALQASKIRFNSPHPGNRCPLCFQARAQPRVEVAPADP